MKIPVTEYVLFCLTGIVLFCNSSAASRLDDYYLYADRRVAARPRISRNRIPNAEACAYLCQSISSFMCTVFTYRIRRGRCMLYNYADVKSLTGNTVRTVKGKGFMTYVFKIQHFTGCLPASDPSGFNYHGRKSRTVSGKHCQRWDANLPHRPTYRPANASEHKNYCRNPDRDSKSPWCYTTDSNQRWEYCSIPKCRSTVPTRLPPAEPECMICNGLNYTGHFSRTRSGKTCQRWDSSSPHKHSSHPDEKPGKHLESNYCRNPDGDIQPWCYTTDRNTRWEYCDINKCTNSAGGLLMPPVRYTLDCVEGRGENYRGVMSQTKSGRTCADWNSQSPHKHTRTPENYPCSGLISNQCRNPAGSYKGGLWCYTTDRNTRWEVCDVPKCGPHGRPLPTVRSTTTTARTTAMSRSPLSAIAGNCGVPSINPSFIVQAFNIQDSGLVAARRTKRSASDQKERILGGDNAVHGSWPWSISLRYFDKHFCGGTLIKTQWILTAAHCLDDRTPSSYLSVKVGHHKGVESQMQMRRVQMYVLHERYYKGQVHNDIAVMKMVSPFEITDFVKLACLPNAGYIVPAGSNCVVTGWGRTYDPKYESQLKQAVLPVKSPAECIRYLGRKEMLDQTQLCAGWRGGRHDTCKGDSGGPFVCLNNNRWTVQGITSWGSSCDDRKGSYGSYTRVSKYVGWIEDKIQRNS